MLTVKLMKALYFAAIVGVFSTFILGQNNQNDQKIMPQIKSVEPGGGQVESEMTAFGSNLEETSVTELRLTDGTNDFKVTILSQTTKSIKFKIPKDIKPGRYALVTCSRRAGRDLEVEQPVKINIE